MSIKVKAMERNVSFQKGVEKWAYVLQADLYSKLSQAKVIEDPEDDNPTDPNGSGSNGSNGSSGSNTTRQYTISVTSANTAQGTVTGGGTYSEGSRVNISASAKSGYAFDKWSDGVTTATRTISVSKNESFVASFKAVEQSGDDSTDTGEGGNTGGDPSYL